MKKIIAALMLVTAFASCSWAWFVGSGTEDDPYVIANASDFSYFRYRVNNGLDDEGCYYLLSNDIQLTRQTLEAPVGILKVSSDLQTVMHDYSFKGHFDGNNHIIYVKILPFYEIDKENSAKYDRALFGYVNTDGDYAVKNLRVGGYVSGNFPAGIVSRLGSGRIEGCKVSADVNILASSASEARSHRYIGAPTESYDNTYAFGGGIVANMYGGEIVSCDFSGKVKTEEADFSHAGGITGFIWATSALLQGCNVRHYATVTAKGDSASSGGIVGYLEVEDLASASGDVTVTGCTFEGGEISSDYSAGGIAGIVYGGILTDNTVGSDTRINGATFAGGIAGTLSAGALVSENNVEGGIVQADSRASGGIVGLLELGYVESNDAKSSVQGDASYKGGVIGEIHNHYGSSSNVMGNTYAGAEFGVGIDEHLQMNQNIAGTTKQSATLSFLTPSRLPSVKEKENYSASIQLSVPAIIDISPIPTWLNPVQAGNIISMSCIPQTTGTFEFTLNATYGEQTASRTYSLTVNSKLSVNSTRDFPEYADLGAFFAYTFSANAGGEDISSLTWTASGDLPGGLILNPTTGRLSGNPTNEGEYTFEILANADNMSQASTGALTLTVAKAISIIADGAASRDNVVYLPTAMIDDDFRFALHIDQSGLTEQWYIQAGNFPSGLTIDESTGLIYGAPDTAGTYYFVVGVNAGTMSATQEMSMAILPTLEISTSSLPAIRIDTPYTATISTNAVYGTPISWDITGLPEGLSYNASGLICTISGTVSEVERYTVTVQASYGSYSASKTFTLNAVRGFTILTDELPIGKTSYGYSFRLTTNAASSDAVAWSVIGGNLPNGTTLDSNTGRISGTPSASGSFDFTVQAVTSRDYTSKDLEIFISDKLVITTNSELKDAEISKDYSVQLMTNIGLVSVWTLEGGLLPDGLVLSSDGTITGKPTEYGDFTFTLKVEAGGLEAWGDFMLTVLPSFYISTGENLGTAEVGKPYSRLLLTNRDTSSAKWYVVGGTFPEGLSLSRDKGLISGTPTVGTSYDFTVQAVSGVNTDEKRFSLVVKPALEIITPATLPPASRDYPYDYTISTDATSAVTWNFISGDIPSGIGFEDGTISGTPTEAGPFTFTVEALSDGKRSAKTFTLYVADYLEILTSPTLPSANEGVPYSYTLITNADDASAIRWYVISGDAPIEPETTTGLLSWTPSHDDVSDDAYVFEVQAVYGRLTASRVFTLKVEPVMSVLTPSVLREARVNSRYSCQLRANVNGATWEVSGGTLPGGLTLSGDVITGTPATAGEYSFTVKASSGTLSAVKTLTLKVGTELQILSSALKAAKVNEQYSHTFRTNKGDASWNVISSDLPGGLTLEASTGIISGKPTNPGSFDFTLQAIAGGLTASRDFTLTVNPELRITTNSVLPSARRNTLYSYILATDSDMAVTWDLMGYLPSGMTLNGDTGEIVGIPAEAGEFGFTVQATAGDLHAEKEFTLTVLDEMVITTSTLPAGKLGAEYACTLAANSPSSVIWTLLDGDLPNGLILGRTTGKISGTPIASGDFAFIVQAVSGGSMASKDFTLTVDGSLTIVTGETLPSAQEGQEYSQTLMADASAVWSIASGKLPTGLALSSTGEISGTPSETGAFSFTVLAVSGTLTARKDFTLTVIPALVITTASLTSGREGSVYSVTLTAEPYSSSTTSWYKISGDLPAGMALNQSTGTISGTPSEHGTFTFRIAAIRGNFSAYRDFTLTVEAVLQITTLSPLPSATSSMPYSYILMTNAAGTDTVTWSAVSSLPSGLSLDASTGEISGTPSSYGTFVFSVRADSGSAFDVKDFSLTVSASSSLRIATDTLPSGTLGTQYSYTLAAESSSGTLVWQIVSGDLPAGLTLNRSTGTISGTPTLAETFMFTVEASSGGQSDRKSFTVTISPVLMITTGSLPSGKKDTAYSYTLALNTSESADWSVIAGTLPEGLSLDVSSGTISGIPSNAGDSVFTVQAVSGGLMASKNFTLTISPVISITSSADLPAGKVNSPYVFTLAADAGHTVSWSVISGALPQGLTLGTSTGIISGTPSAEGTFTFTVQVAEGTITSQKSFTLTINPVLNILTASPLPNGKINTPYSLTFASDKTPATWEILSGDLPDGLALSSGTISGIPIEEGTFAFTLRAAYGSASSDKDFTLTIRPAMSIVTAETLPSAKTGQQYSCTLQTDATGLVPSWEVVSGDLPDGLSMDRMTGTISGTPSSEGTYSFNVQAKAGSITALKEFMLTVEAAMSIVTSSVLPSASTSGNYTFTLTVDGGRAAIWYLVGGSLPDGLRLDTASGTISGFTQAEGTYSFTVQAISGALTAIKDFTLTVGTEIIIATPSALNAGSAGSSYSHTFTVDGGRAAEWSVISGDVPQGLTLNSRTGTLSGTPVIAGSYAFMVQATSGYSSAVKTFTLNIALVISTTTLLNGTTGERYSHVLEAKGASSNTLTWSISADRVIPGSSQDVMPHGLTLAPDGVISGTPLQAGTFTFTVYVSSDNDLKADKMVHITIDSPSAVPITTTSLPDGKVNRDYHAELLTTETDVTWKHTAGTLPPGLTLSENGLISGVPTQAGAFTFTVTAMKDSGQPGTRQLTLTIEPADERKTESDDRGTTGSGGGGGCNSDGMMLLAGMLMFLRRKK